MLSHHPSETSRFRLVVVERVHLSPHQLLGAILVVSFDSAIDGHVGLVLLGDGNRLLCSLEHLAICGDVPSSNVGKHSAPLVAMLERLRKHADHVSGDAVPKLMHTVKPAGGGVVGGGRVCTVAHAGTRARVALQKVMHLL